MTYKWDNSSAAQYAKEIAAKISDENYVDIDVLEGEQLLDITPIKQINLLIIRELYEKWQNETRRLESPFFDYNNPAVKQALEQFMNTLSQYIAVKRTDFEPLLSKAIANSLQLVLKPDTFFEQFLRDLPNFRLSEDFILDNRKYFSYYRYVLDDLADSLTTQPTIYANEAISLAKNSLVKGGVESPTDLMDYLATVSPVPAGLKENVVIPAIVQPIREEKQKSFFDQIVEERLVEKIKAEPDNTRIEVPPVMVAPPVIVTPSAPSVVVEIPKFEVTEQPMAEKAKRLNDHLEQATQTLNDKATSMESVQAVTSNYHRISKIESIRKSISLNQRFLFIHNLFGGNVEAFSQALDEIDTLPSFAEARELVLKKYVPRYLWDVTSVEAEEFFEILKRRFN